MSYVNRVSEDSGIGQICEAIIPVPSTYTLKQKYPAPRMINFCCILNSDLTN